MTDFNNMKLKDIIQMDLKNVVEKLILQNKDRLNYNKESQAWFIDEDEIVDELWYDCYTITHPKEIIGYVEEYIEEELKIPKDDTNE